MGFRGYLRADGSVGIRNHIVIVASVSCANGVVNAVARQLPEVKALTHTEGCGRGPTDLVNSTRTLVGFGKNPNVAGVLVVGLGCEFLKAPWIASEIKSSGKPVEMLVIQGEGGSQKTTEKALAAVRRLLEQTQALESAEFDWNKLTLGLECGGESEAARATSPALGACGDWLVGEGGKVIVAELAEMAARDTSLAERVARPELLGKIEAAFENKRKLVLKALGRELAYELPPGAGAGLSALASHSKVSDVLEFAEAPSAPGLYLMDTPGSEIFSMTAMAAGGAQLIVQTTEHGIPGGCPVAPVIKVSTKSELFALMADDIDFDAGRISAGTPSDQVGRELVQLIGDVARGRKTKAEINGYDLFALHTSGPAF